MVQTPEQRKRNERFAKEQDQRRGKAAKDIQKNGPKPKSPISPVWLGLLAFIIFGGLIFELISRIFFR